MMNSSAGPRERILANFAGLPAKQRQFARFFLDQEDLIAFASVNEISEQAGTSAATVVRFCRALGYEGYSDLQAAVRAKFPQYRTAVQKLTERMTGGAFNLNLPAQIAQSNIDNIQHTLGRVSGADLAAVVSAIVGAREIRIFGSGLAAAAATLAEYSLTMLGFSARAEINGGLPQIVQLSHLTNRDLVIIISLWRYLRYTVEAAKATRAAGATCIALTDSPVSPVASLADYVFVADIESAAHSRSLTGLLTLIELISAAIVSERPKESLAALERIDTIYRQSGILWSD